MFLHPTDAPVVSLETADGEELTEGMDVIIPCYAHYHPNTGFSVNWYHNGERLDYLGWDEHDMSFKKKDLTYADRGNITCEVCNIVGCTFSEPFPLVLSCE